MKLNNEISNEVKLKTICHIVELTHKYIYLLQSYIDKYSTCIVLLNLEDLSNEIDKSDHMIKLIDDYTEQKKNFNSKMKDTENLIKEYWQNTMIEMLNNKINEIGNKKVICIGKCIYELLNIKLNLDISKKYYFNGDIDKIIEHLIELNIDNNRKQIIKGTYSLDYLNKIYLKKKRMTVQSLYMKMDYVLIDWKDILNLINPTRNISEYWYASFNKQDLSDKLYVYRTEWLALANLLSDTDIDKGLLDGVPYIKENKEFVLQKLKTSGYLYKIKADNVLINKNNTYKFKILQPFKIITVNKINIFKQLSSYSVNFIYYESNKSRYTTESSY
jgi:hypothetical protein